MTSIDLSDSSSEDRETGADSQFLHAWDGLLCRFSSISLHEQGALELPISSLTEKCTKFKLNMTNN